MNPQTSIFWDSIHYRREVFDDLAQFHIDAVVAGAARILLDGSHIDPSQPAITNWAGRDYAVNATWDQTGLFTNGSETPTLVVRQNDLKCFSIPTWSQSGYSLLLAQQPADNLFSEVVIYVPAGAPATLGAAFLANDITNGFQNTTKEYLALTISTDSRGDAGNIGMVQLWHIDTVATELDSDNLSNADGTRLGEGTTTGVQTNTEISFLISAGNNATVRYREDGRSDWRVIGDFPGITIPANLVGGGPSGLLFGVGAVTAPTLMEDLRFNTISITSLE